MEKVVLYGIGAVVVIGGAIYLFRGSNSSRDTFTPAGQVPPRQPTQQGDETLNGVLGGLGSALGGFIHSGGFNSGGNHSNNTNADKSGNGNGDKSGGLVGASEGDIPMNFAS